MNIVRSDFRHLFSSVFELVHVCCPDFFGVIVWGVFDKDFAVFFDCIEGNAIAEHFSFVFEAVYDFERDNDCFCVVSCDGNIPSFSAGGVCFTDVTDVISCSFECFDSGFKVVFYDWSDFGCYSIPVWSIAHSMVNTASGVVKRIWYLWIVLLSYSG